MSKTGYAMLVDPTVVYTDRTLATASWWDKYNVDEGTYPLEYVDGRGDVLAEGADSRFCDARTLIPATLIESYRESRLLQYSTAHHKEGLSERTNLYFRIYGYQLTEEYVGRKWWSGAITLVKL